MSNPGPIDLTVSDSDDDDDEAKIVDDEEVKVIGVCRPSSPSPHRSNPSNRFTSSGTSGGQKKRSGGSSKDVRSKRSKKQSKRSRTAAAAAAAAAATDDVIDLTGKEKKVCVLVLAHVVWLHVCSSLATSILFLTYCTCM